jgi:outer membrane protein OmpA-like peptidoglycan-associated protein
LPITPTGLLLGFALAGPRLEVGAQGIGGLGETGLGLGHLAAVAWPTGPGATELRTRTNTGPEAQFAAEIAWRQTLPSREGPKLSLLAGAGINLIAVSPALSAGFAVDTPNRDRSHLRVGALFASSGAGHHSLALQFSHVLDLRQKPGVGRTTWVVREQAPAPKVDTPPPPAPETRIWLTEPICAWVTTEEARVSLPQLAPAEQQTLAELLDTRAAETPEPDRATLLVLAHPGDEVRVGGQILRLAPDGVGELETEPGQFEVVVNTGGATQHYPIALAPGFAVWLRVKDPEPMLVTFAQGSAELSPDALRTLDKIARSAGTWSFALQGGYSPEGDLNYNFDLADRRATAVAEALQARGLSKEQLRLLEPARTSPYASVEQMRNCAITPIPGGSP